MNNLLTRRKQLDRKLSDRRHLKKLVWEGRDKLKSTQQQIADIEEAQQIVQHVSQVIQQSAHKQIASIVSKCLRIIFGPDAYIFKIDFVKARGKTEARLLFERDGVEIDPKFGAGGGVLDVASMALRLACLRLSQPQQRMCLILDEPFRFLSEEYRFGIRQMLRLLSKKLKIQIVMISHHRELIDERSIVIE